MAGVDSVPSLVLVVDDIERAPCTDVSLAGIAPNALLQLTAYDVSVVTQREVTDA